MCIAHWAEASPWQAISSGGTAADVITAINGEPVRNISDLATILEPIGVGKTAQLTVERDGRSRTVEGIVADVSGLMRG